MRRRDPQVGQRPGRPAGVRADVGDALAELLDDRAHRRLRLVERVVVFVPAGGGAEGSVQQKPAATR